MRDCQIDGLIKGDPRRSLGTYRFRQQKSHRRVSEQTIDDPATEHPRVPVTHKC